MQPPKMIFVKLYLPYVEDTFLSLLSAFSPRAHDKTRQPYDDHQFNIATSRKICTLTHTLAVLIACMLWPGNNQYKARHTNHDAYHSHEPVVLRHLDHQGHLHQYRRCRLLCGHFRHLQMHLEMRESADPHCAQQGC
jgi:hypothetical protein